MCLPARDMVAADCSCERALHYCLISVNKSLQNRDGNEEREKNGGLLCATIAVLGRIGLDCCGGYVSALLSASGYIL